MAISESLGTRRTVELPAGVVEYRERGEGPAIVFVHGITVTADLWRKVVPLLADDFRCIAPDWPQGSHTIPMNESADLTPAGQAQIISDFLDVLDLRDVILVANDSGGALSQLVIVNHPDRVGRLVLATCDAFDNFPPPRFSYLKWGSFVPGLPWLLAQNMRLQFVRRLPIAFGPLIKHPIEKEIYDAYCTPVARDPRIRRDTVKYLKSLHPRYTQEAAKAFPHVEQPVLLAWAPENKIFPLAHAERMAQLFPNASLETIEDSYVFVSEDQPERLAELIRKFAAPAP